MEQNKEMLERFRAMLEAVDQGLATARSRRLERTNPSVPAAPPPASGSVADTSGRPRFKAVRIQPRPTDEMSSG